MTFTGRQRLVDGPVGPDVPLVIALHGGTYTSEYFDIAGYSLLDRAAALGIPTIALDRPNYAGSSPLAAEGSIILANAGGLSATPSASSGRANGSGTAGVVLVGHSIGGAVATAIAAAPRQWPLLGLAISGCLVRVPAESRAAWESLPDIPMIDLPTPMKDQVMFGPAGSYADGMPAASHPSNTLVPKAELLDITGGWIAARAEVCARVDVPVHHRQGQFDALWVTDQAEIDEFRDRLCRGAVGRHPAAGREWPLHRLPPCRCLVPALSIGVRAGVRRRCGRQIVTTVLTDVRVFDGERFGDPSDLLVEGGLIAAISPAIGGTRRGGFRPCRPDRLPRPPVRAGNPADLRAPRGDHSARHGLAASPGDRVAGSAGSDRHPQLHAGDHVAGQ